MGCCSTSSCGGCKFGYTLIMIGSINWGLVGISSFLGQDLNVIHMITGIYPAIEAAIYILIGLAAISKLFKLCKCCKE